MVEGRRDTPNLRLALLFEEQGVVIVETGRSKHFYFTPHLTQTKVNYIEEALKAKELLSPNGIPRDGLAERFHSSAFVPPLESLTDLGTYAEETLQSRAEIEVLELEIPRSIKAANMITMELVRRIKMGQELFGDWRPYAIPKTPKRSISHPPV